MPFTQATKNRALRRSAHRCCICHDLATEMHHILRQSEGGADTLENAAPLCGSCHDLYAHNAEMRHRIRQMRDDWWRVMDERRKRLTTADSLHEIALIHRSKDYRGQLRSRYVAIYHYVFENESFETAATHLFKLVRRAQETSPGQNRALYLDIEGHRNEAGGYDQDMFHLQKEFVLGFLMYFLSKAHLPLMTVCNPRLQRNDLPDSLRIIHRLDQESLNELLESDEPMSIWVADRAKWLNIGRGPIPASW